MNFGIINKVEEGFGNMYIKAQFKKRLIISVITVLILVLTILGSTYALFMDVKSNTEDQVLSVGDLQVTYTGGSIISINNVTPVDEVSGMNATDNIYTLTVENVGTLSYHFNIAIKDNEAYLPEGANYDANMTLLSHDYIRYSINNSTAETLGAQPGGIVFKGVLNPGQKRLYKVRLWVTDRFPINNGAPNIPNESLGSQIHLSVVVDGNAGAEKLVYNDGDAVYFNPETGLQCTNYITSNSDTGYRGTTLSGGNGCMKWYAFNDAGGQENVNLILDHNTTAIIAWNNTGSNVNQPVTVMAQLGADTTNWLNVVKATVRLISANEIAHIVGHKTFNSNLPGMATYFIEDVTAAGTVVTPNPVCTIDGNVSGCKYGWLMDRIATTCTTFGCNNNANAGSMWGYWTSSPASADSSGQAWFMRGTIGKIMGTFGTSDGVRPVITIPKTSLS